MKMWSKFHLIFFINSIQSFSKSVLYMSENLKNKEHNNEAPWEASDRIPNSTYPQHYDLYLHPDLNSKYFTGNVNIKIVTTEPTDYFLVHTRLLNINNETLVLERMENKSQNKVKILKSFEYTPNQFYVIQTEVVPPGTYQLFMEFSGSLKGKIVGFYASEYATATNETRILATTKFQPTYAREAFPCFDEPSFRSSYKITLVRPSDGGYIGLNNMPVQSETPNSPSPGLTEVHFEKSVSMVTYLVCFIVCDFTYKEINETTMRGEIPFRVYAPADKIEDMQYALDFGAKTLQFYEVMFDYPFPLPKSDMAAIPDYSSGATEHWGLITYRESRIFYNQNRSSARDYQSVSTVIAHELAHQWFGNLVTLSWWNDLWLNEGFASYIEYKGTAYNHPTWDMEAQFVIDRIQSVFDLDSKVSSHPIVKVVQTPEEINAMFDTISYDKGASILRMLEGFMGADFQKGVNEFLKKFAFENALTQDLWDCLTEAWKDNVTDEEKTDIGDIMNTWTMQMGYPVVTIHRTSPTQLTATQSRFLKDPEAKYNSSESPFNYAWDISLSLVTSIERNPRNYWLYRENEKLVINISEEVTWFKLNSGQEGYYRVNYSPEIWANLEVLCASLALPPEDRSSLYDDALSLAEAARMDYAVALNLTRSLASEDHYVPWKSASRKFIAMEYLFLQTDVELPLKSYLRELIENKYEEIRWQDQGTHLDRLLRNVVVNLASMSDVESSLEEAGNYLQAWIDDESYLLPLDTKRHIYWWGMVRAGSNANWEIMWQRCMAELDAGQKNNLYYGLSNSQDAEVLRRYINLTFDLDNTRMQDFLTIVGYIAQNPIGIDIAWDWVRTNWDSLIDRYGTNDRYLGQLIPKITYYFKTPQKLVEMEIFYHKAGQSGAVAQYRDQALDTVKYNIYWVKTYSSVILQWLKSRDKRTQSTE